MHPRRSAVTTIHAKPRFPDETPVRAAVGSVTQASRRRARMPPSSMPLRSEAGTARPTGGWNGAADLWPARHGRLRGAARHGRSGPFRRCRAQRSSQMRSSAAELVWEAPGVSAHCVETDSRSASGRDLHYLSWIGKNRAAPSAPRPWPSAETSSARGRRPLRIVKLVDDLRPSNRRLRATENSLRC